MSAFRALVWKEWRDARATVLVAGAAAVALTFAWHVLLPSSLPASYTAGFALVGMPALFITVLAGDLVAGEARGGRLASLRALPVSPIASFGAKLAWLVLASGSFLAWCFALQLPCLAWLAIDGALGRFLFAAPQTLPFVLLGAALGAGALFASTLGVGGLKAVLLSALVIGLPLAALVQVALAFPMPLGAADLNRYSLTCIAGALLAAALTSCKGRLHLGARWRPALVGWTTLAVCALPPTGLAARRLASWLSLGPGSVRAEAAWLLAAPDGRHVAVQVMDLNTADHPVVTVWMVEVESGALEVLSGLHWTSERWSDAGELLLVKMRPDTSPDFEEAQRLDPDSMELRGPPRDPRELYAPWQVFPDWAHVERLGDGDGPRRVHWRGRDSSALFKAGPPGRVLPQHVPGVVLFHDKAGGLVRVELGAERTTLVERGVELRRNWDLLSTDDRLVLARVNGAGVVLDAHTGALVAGPWPECSVQWLHHAPIGRFVLRHRRAPGFHHDMRWPCTLIDLESGMEVELGRLLHANGGARPSVCRLPDGRLVVLRPDGAVELLAGDGELLRVLVAGR